jgi:muconate cycloisomerase
VITGGSIGDAAKRAEQMMQVGLSDVKLKVGAGDDLARVRAVREAVGPHVSLRLDANAAWDLPSAISILESVTPYEIAAVEQPFPRAADGDLPALRRATEIPVMVDESLITVDDAERLLANQAVDQFNVRISKCGGLSPSLRIANMATEAGVGVQLGCQVGETAILSAAGRHLAMALPAVTYLEGSYGTLLLVEDVATESVRFGRKGKAGALSGPGLGIEVVDDVLRRYAEDTVHLDATTPR